LESLKERGHLEDLGVDRRDNIKISLKKIGYEGVDWINMAQDRDMWRAFVSTAMKIRVP
jgi:hypothetical protein